jgi:hypothetical protein
VLYLFGDKSQVHLKIPGEDRLDDEVCGRGEAETAVQMV